ncbi:outer membrane protein assembly factor BamE [Hyphomonas johnsonii]|uniref:SmpA/OmlA family protein n=1 Tax=Hyphomonas johnsonii MHS-2 TaxID=1280950 RepID=A0A059FTN3_9PROT|nr:outer membrane protein assembly factor BamE [Hyphomonas johnsonii]KCZ93967.1 SmpA/OmlA family protein [Hyphomonas johnsonii MHS-2]
MSRRAILAIGLLTLPLTACLTPTRDYHGYVADEAQPRDMTPDVDTRSTVLAKLGSPSTKSVFDDKTWVYMSDVQSRIAFFKPKITNRSVTAIRFGDDDKVDEVLEYSADDGEVVNYAARETPTRGRELGLWEQIFGTVGGVRLPNSDERTPGNPTGR